MDLSANRQKTNDMKTKEILGLERHAYAPELNTLHFTDGTSVRAPQCQTIDEAMKYVPTESEEKKNNTLKLMCKLSEIKDEVQQVQDSIDFDDAENLWNDVSDIKSDIQRLLYKLQKT